MCQFLFCQPHYMPSDRHMPSFLDKPFPKRLFGNTYGLRFLIDHNSYFAIARGIPDKQIIVAAELS